MHYTKMNDKSYIVFPLRRIAVSIYDFFLLIGVWFAVGFISVWINGGPFVGMKNLWQRIFGNDRRLY